MNWEYIKQLGFKVEWIAEYQATKVSMLKGKWYYCIIGTNLKPEHINTSITLL